MLSGELKNSSLKERQFPCCTLCLILSAFTCHLCVLIGNLQTASALKDLGFSTRGWSRVGLGIAHSLEHELDEKMNEVSGQLLKSLSHIGFVQDSMEMLMAVVGNETDASLDNASSNTSELFSKHLSLVQKEGSDPLQALVPVVAGSVHHVIESMQNKVAHLLHELLELLKPALKQVTDWLTKFGETIQNSIEAFSVTLDRVQKIFDQVMSQLNGHGGNGESLLDEVIGLFNVDNSGDIDINDLHAVADLYSITALKGEKADELMKKYDDSGDLELQYEEMQDFVTDPSLPDLMTVVLRTYARRMTEVAGTVRAARMRDELTEAVAQYLGLVCAKNLTRAEWVADALTNGSLPLMFTADIMAQLCLTADDPSFMTSADTGVLMVNLMYSLQPGYTLQALDQLSNTSAWVDEGFDAKDQPKCMKLLTKWITNAKMATTRAPSSFDATPEGNRSVMELLSASQHSAAEKEVLLAMPSTALSLAEEGVTLFLLEEQHVRRTERQRRFTSTGSQVLLAQLFGGAAPKDHNAPSSTKKAVSAGQPARPESLLFGKWLAANASIRADQYVAECFDYSTQSSNAVDSFATQIQAMVSKTESFLNVMTKYTTPAAIDRLEVQVEDFINHAMGDVIKVVEDTIVRKLNSSMPLVEGAVRHAAHAAGEQLGHKIGDALGSPMGQAMKPPIQDVISDLTNGNSAGNAIGAQLGDHLAEAISNLSSQILGDQVGAAMEDLVVKGLEASGNALADKLDIGNLHLGLLQERRLAGLPAVVTGVWQQMSDMLKKLVNVLPSATSSLKSARKEVSRLYSNLNSIFQVFEGKGLAVFESISSLWRMLWTIYFIVLISMYPIVLYYLLWCRGYFGGPQPLTPEELEAYQKPSSFRESCEACCRCCTACMKVCHDTSTCMWSVLILIQVLALIVFVVSIVLCMLAGVKALLSSGCVAIYVINDMTICTETLSSIRSFLETFTLFGGSINIEDSCAQDQLLACDMIARKMARSTILTTVFSMLSSVLTLQLIFEMALGHEQARWRRRVLEMEQPKSQELTEAP